MTTVGVFATILNGSSKVLCVRRNYPPYGWTTPGGRLEDGESPEVAVVREVLEETGYQVVIDRLVGIYSAPFKSDLVISFLCTPVSRELWQPDGEIAAVEFFAVDALPPMRGNSRQRIQDAIEGRVGVWRTFGPEEHA
ncbi:NUDIX hydrolase [Cupriavidus necator]|uniref:NUDIX hydrolase n=1 Tax=Cupriavidus necator TaxID=106590 RepID=A0A2P1DUZ6_CUPNE|nr:NUDIX hydrolase [Cupriavidus necator]